MDKEREQQVLASIYDRLYDAICHAPSGSDSPFQPGSSFIQMAKNVVINPSDFDNMMSPGNPGGDLTKAELFSAFVDQLPNTESLWADSGKKASETYMAIVNGANTDSQINPDQKALYDQAFNFLNTSTRIRDFRGNEKIKTEPSDILKAYDSNMAAFVNAISGYRTAYNGYDLTKIADQKEWSAVSPGLQLVVDQARSKLENEGRSEVIEAQNALMSTINDAIRYIISQARADVDDNHQLPSNSVAGKPWLPSYALPSNWFAPDIKGSKLTIKSSYLNQSASSEATSYAASASGGWGLWHAGGGVSGNHQEQRSHMDAEYIDLTAELILVQIKRPWFNPLLFSMKDWWMSPTPALGISNGTVEGPSDRLMPMIPTGFVVARNVSIAAEFSEQDKKFVADSIQAGASGGWGPFSVSGKYSHSTSSESFAAKFDGGRLEMPGLQLVAWINSIIPPCPPLSPR
jgi:hypothetical protein